HGEDFQSAVQAAFLQLSILGENRESCPARQREGRGGVVIPVLSRGFLEEASGYRAIPGGEFQDTQNVGKRSIRVPHERPVRGQANLAGLRRQDLRQLGLATGQRVHDLEAIQRLVV